MAMRRAVLGGCGISGLIVAVGIVGATRPPEAKDEAERLRVQQATVEKIADSLIARMEKEADLRRKLSEHEKAMLGAPTDLEQTRKTLEVQKIGLDEYLEGTYPTDHQTAEGEIKIAELELARATDRLKDVRKRGGETAIRSAELARDKAKYSVEQAERQLKVLEDYEKPRQVRLLTANVEATEKLVRECEELVEHGPQVGEDLKRQVKEESLSKSEARALRLLEDVITLQDKGDPDAAQAKLDEAEGLWRSEEDRHAAIRFQTTKQRIRDAVKNLSAPAPKSE